jgi:hypothetical protein
MMNPSGTKFPGYKKKWLAAVPNGKLPNQSKD